MYTTKKRGSGVMRACAEQALRNMMDMYIYFLFMYVSQSNLVLPVSLSGLITIDNGFFLCQCLGRKNEGCPAKKNTEI